jgi:hypothetical protein
MVICFSTDTTGNTMSKFFLGSSLEILKYKRRFLLLKHHSFGVWKPLKEFIALLLMLINDDQQLSMTLIKGDHVQQWSTVFDSVRQCSTVFDRSQQCSTVAYSAVFCHNVMTCSYLVHTCVEPFWVQKYQ